MHIVHITFYPLWKCCLFSFVTYPIQWLENHIIWHRGYSLKYIYIEFYLWVHICKWVHILNKKSSFVTRKLGCTSISFSCPLYTLSPQQVFLTIITCLVVFLCCTKMVIKQPINQLQTFFLNWKRSLKNVLKTFLKRFCVDRAFLSFARWSNNLSFMSPLTSLSFYLINW